MGLTWNVCFASCTSSSPHLPARLVAGRARADSSLCTRNSRQDVWGSGTTQSSELSKDQSAPSRPKTWSAPSELCGLSRQCHDFRCPSASCRRFRRKSCRLISSPNWTGREGTEAGGRDSTRRLESNPWRTPSCWRDSGSLQDTTFGARASDTRICGILQCLEPSSQRNLCIR